MGDAGIRGALCGVNELVTFLENASSNDRSAFQKRANVIFECRTCCTLFRKADGFMRHVMRCDSSRVGDFEGEVDRRSAFVSPSSVTAPVASPALADVRVSHAAPVRSPVPNGVSSAANNPASALQQSALMTKPFVRKKGRPSNAEKAAKYLLMKREEAVMPTTTPPVVMMANSNGAKTAPGRPPKRPYNRKPKIKKDEDHSDEVSSNVSSTKVGKGGEYDGELGGEIRPSRMRKTPKWLEDHAFVM